MTGFDGRAALAIVCLRNAAVAAALAVLLAACADGGANALLSAGLAADPQPATQRYEVAALAGQVGNEAGKGAEGKPQPRETAQLEAAQPGSAAGTVGATRISLMPLPANLPVERATALTESMTAMLAAQGYEIVPAPQAISPGESIYILDADISIDATGGKEKIGIDWRVSDALGEPVGKVSQTAALPANISDAQWKREATLAAAAAAESLARIVPRRP